MSKEVIKQIADVLDDRRNMRRQADAMFYDVVDVIFLQECRLRGVSDTEIVDYLMQIGKSSRSVDRELFADMTEDLLELMEVDRGNP
jgi:hypothetical protein